MSVIGVSVSIDCDQDKRFAFQRPTSSLRASSWRLMIARYASDYKTSPATSVQPLTFHMVKQQYSNAGQCSSMASLWFASSASY